MKRQILGTPTENFRHDLRLCLVHQMGSFNFVIRLPMSILLITITIIKIIMDYGIMELHIICCLISRHWEHFVFHCSSN